MDSLPLYFLKSASLGLSTALPLGSLQNSLPYYSKES